MNNPYDDILYLSYPFPTSRKRMSMTERGAQFSPFAALTGFDAAIRETGRLTERQIELDMDERTMLDEKLQSIFQIQYDRPEITVTYFIPDNRKTGGSYARITGNLKRIDPHQEIILMMDGTTLSFSCICDIEADILRDQWMEEENISPEV